MLLFCFHGGAHAQDSMVCFPGECVHVTIVSTDEAMAKGLSGHGPLGSNEGMLFAFSMEGTYSFWMNDMNFALDIVWFNKDGKVVYIQEHLMPCTKDNCPKYASPDPAQYVLEAPAGYIKTHHIQIGDSALLPKDPAK